MLKNTCVNVPVLIILYIKLDSKVNRRLELSRTTKFSSKLFIVVLIIPGLYLFRSERDSSLRNRSTSSFSRLLSDLVLENAFFLFLRLTRIIDVKVAATAMAATINKNIKLRLWLPAVLLDCGSTGSK